MVSNKTTAVPPIKQDSDNTSIAKIFDQHDQALTEHGLAAAQALPPELQRIAQVLCDTYETLDLRIETTLGNAASDFLTALPEVQGHDDDLRQLVALLIGDLRRTAEATSSQPVLLHLAFKDEGDLAQQLLSSLETQEDEP